MRMFSSIALGSNLYKGYTFEQALDMIKNIGFDYVEPASIVNMCEHIAPEQMNEEYASYVKELLKKKELRCLAFSGHVDLTEEKQFEDFLKKIEFVGRIGAKIINTNSGPQKNVDIFKKNMLKVIEVAEKWNVTVCLESHGDIVDTAKNSAEIFEYFHHPLVRLNYDTGNVLFYSRGKVDVAEDIKYASEHLEYLHLKDIKIRGNDVWYMPIGEGDVDFKAFFNSLAEIGRKIPCAYEIPVHVKGVLENIYPHNTPMSETKIKEAVSKSVGYVEKIVS